MNLLYFAILVEVILISIGQVVVGRAIHAMFKENAEAKRLRRENYKYVDGSIDLRGLQKEMERKQSELKTREVLKYLKESI